MEKVKINAKIKIEFEVEEIGCKKDAMTKEEFIEFLKEDFDSEDVDNLKIDIKDYKMSEVK